MRLIDADALEDKEFVFDAEHEEWYWAVKSDDIETAPTIDAVPVVRCKNCKYWLKDVAECTESFGRCEWADWMVGVKWMVGENGYCVYADRKEV